MDRTWKLNTTANDGSKGLHLENIGDLAELVVGDWLRIEKVSEREWAARIGKHCVQVYLPDTGPPHVIMQWDAFAEK